MRCAGAKDERDEEYERSREPGALPESLQNSPSRGDSTRKHSAHLIRQMVRACKASVGRAPSSAVFDLDLRYSNKIESTRRTQQLQPQKRRARAPAPHHTIPSVCCRMLHPRVFVNHAALHHEIDMLQRAHVGQGIGIHRNDVGKLAGLNGAHILGPSNQIGGA